MKDRTASSNKQHPLKLGNKNKSSNGADRTTPEIVAYPPPKVAAQSPIDSDRGAWELPSPNVIKKPSASEKLRNDRQKWRKEKQDSPK